MRCFIQYLCSAFTYQELKNNWHIQIVPRGINQKSSVMKTRVVINMSPIGKILQSKWITQYSQHLIIPNNRLNIYLPSICQRLKYFELRHQKRRNEEQVNQWMNLSMNENWQYAHLHVQSASIAKYLSIASRLNWIKEVLLFQKEG